MLLRNRLLPSAARLVLYLGTCTIALFSYSACSAGNSARTDDDAVVRVT